MAVETIATTKRGKRANLTLQHLTALASYFSDTLGLRITLSYFDPATPVEQPWADAHAPDGAGSDDRAFVEAMRDRGVRRADEGGHGEVVEAIIAALERHLQTP